MRYMKRCYRENISFNLYSTFGHCIYFGLHYFDLIRLMDFVHVLYFNHNLLILDDNNNNGNNNNIMPIISLKFNQDTYFSHV